MERIVNIKRIVVGCDSSWRKVFRVFLKRRRMYNKRIFFFLFFFFFFLVTLGTTIRQKQLRTQLRKVHRAAL